ncbi:hypothetical protein AGMMS4952_21030 [Spirochaetia bacterium]|nr:hypothetical protein AGMMS4952_21030 [Spirochaetia bacterium]
MGKHTIYLDNCVFNRPFDDIEYLGSVNTERFINSIKADHFDYTKWQENLWKDKTIDEIHQKATAFYNATH